MLFVFISNKLFSRSINYMRLFYAMTCLCLLPSSNCFPAGSSIESNRLFVILPCYLRLAHKLNYQSQENIVLTMSKEYGSFGSKRGRWKDKKRWKRKYVTSSLPIIGPDQFTKMILQAQPNTLRGLHWDIYSQLARTLKPTASKLHFGLSSISIENATTQEVIFTDVRANTLGTTHKDNDTKAILNHLETVKQNAVLERDLIKNIRGMFGSMPSPSMYSTGR